ncbi:MAG: DUF4398 domain-containing protein [Kofleriaceae bacterium]
MIRVLLVVALALTVTASCGSIVYINDVTRTASSSVEAARAAEADKYSPYYWTRAEQYLLKARERAAHADFQAANRYGRLAAAAAQLAEQEAASARMNPTKQLAPAKPQDATP